MYCTHLKKGVCVILYHFTQLIVSITNTFPQIPTLPVLLQTNVAATLVKMEVHAMMTGFRDADVQRDIRALIVKWVRRTLLLLKLNAIKQTNHA